MKITLDLKKTVEENAQDYFNKSKKAKKKIDGVMQAIEKYDKKLKKLKAQEALEKEKFDEHKKRIEEKKNIKKEWYEKFKWFISSEGFLCISGYDATSNEIIIKKQTDETDIVFHAEMSGSPFTVIKTEGKEVGEITLNEAAQFTAAYSRAWKGGISGLEVFWVKPEQVSKTPQSGEYVNKGSFIIRGKCNYYTPRMEICVGIREDGKIISGARTVMDRYAEKYVILIQADKGKTSDTAKQIRKKLDGGDLDEIVRFVPAGGAKIKEFVEVKKRKQLAE